MQSIVFTPGEEQSRDQRTIVEKEKRDIRWRVEEADLSIFFLSIYTAKKVGCGSPV